MEANEGSGLPEDPHRAESACRARRRQAPRNTALTIRCTSRLGGWYTVRLRILQAGSLHTVTPSPSDSRIPIANQTPTPIPVRISAVSRNDEKLE